MFLLKKIFILALIFIGHQSNASNTKAANFYLLCVKNTTIKASQKISCQKNIDYDSTNFNIQSSCQKLTNETYPNFFDLTGSRNLSYAVVQERQFVTETSIKGYDIIKGLLDKVESNCEISKELKNQSRKSRIPIEFLSEIGTF